MHYKMGIPLNTGPKLSLSLLLILSI